MAHLISTMVLLPSHSVIQFRKGRFSGSMRGYERTMLWTMAKVSGAGDPIIAIPTWQKTKLMERKIWHSPFWIPLKCAVGYLPLPVQHTAAAIMTPNSCRARRRTWKISIKLFLAKYKTIKAGWGNGTCVSDSRAEQQQQKITLKLIKIASSKGKRPASTET